MKTIFSCLLLIIGTAYAISLEDLLPAHGAKDSIVPHAYYTLSYHEGHEQARWVAYKLVLDQLAGDLSTQGRFRPDPGIATGSLSTKDLEDSGFELGHLAPAEDFRWSRDAIAETYYLSNASLQVPSFNNGIWKRLEGKIREWVKVERELYVIAGPVLSGDLIQIGADRVSIPKYFFKVVLDYKLPDLKAIGFIIPNRGSDKPVMSFAVSVDSVESKCGIDFFPKLSDPIQNELESQLNIKPWPE
jgi:endonuclease G